MQSRWETGCGVVERDGQWREPFGVSSGLEEMQERLSSWC